MRKDDEELIEIIDQRIGLLYYPKPPQKSDEEIEKERIEAEEKQNKIEKQHEAELLELEK